jgi:large subunit ribosomal protein L20
MVFTTVANLVRSRGPDEFWRKRRIFKLAAVSLKIYFDFVPK